MNDVTVLSSVRTERGHTHELWFYFSKKDFSFVSQGFSEIDNENFGSTRVEPDYIEDESGKKVGMKFNLDENIWEPQNETNSQA